MLLEGKIASDGCRQIQPEAAGPARHRQ